MSHDDRRDTSPTALGVRAHRLASKRSLADVARFDRPLAGAADPYPVYARLRAEDPIHRTSHGLWVLTRYADVSAVLRDPRFGREGFERHFTAGRDSTNGASPDHADTSPLDAGGSRQSMLFRDPPHHTRLRDAVRFRPMPTPCSIGSRRPVQWMSSLTWPSRSPAP
jgi:cytochrome P450